MAVHRSVKQQLQLDSEDIGSYIWLEDWDFASDRLLINRRGARRLSQLYSSIGGLGSRGKMD
jgi:hypothetical protein